MDYGARVCTPRPRCDECVLARWCPSLARLAPGMRVAEARGTYHVRASRVSASRVGASGVSASRVSASRVSASRVSAPKPPYEESPRWYRGRIIDVLRSLPPGRTISIDALAARIANGSAPDAELTAGLAGQLERDGLLVRRGRRVALPE
jgi:A/G-specific adenine glycosylase